jgi:hypothetical protein
MGEGGERLLAWYFGGDTEYRLPGTEMVFKVSPQPPSTFGKARPNPANHEHPIRAEAQEESQHVEPQ